MRAAYITELGPAENIRHGELPLPRLGPLDVLVAVRAAPVNPVDTFVRSGAYRTPTPFPFVVGRDLAGTVAAVGAGVSGFRVGDAVWANSLGHHGRQGTAAEYAGVPADRLYHLPEGVDPGHAAAVAHPAATAFLGLFRHARLRIGESVYVGGGAGNVGGAAVELAAVAGALVVAGAREADHERCRGLGAHAVVDYRAADLAAAIRAVAPAGVDVFWDTSGHHDLDLAAAVTAPGGRIVLSAGMRARPELPVGAVYTNDVRLVGFAISNATVAELAAAARLVNERLAAGGLPSRLIEALPLDRAAEAHLAIERGRTSGGRLLLTP
jgi:NADPH:quinone reductase-like Zn-dependent oxidoreductase